MRKSAVIVVMGAMLLGTFAAAHAAPSVPGAAPGPIQRTNPPGPVAAAIKKLDVEVLPTATKCGQAHAARVKLTNKTGAFWQGTVRLSADAVVVGGTPPLSILATDTEPKVVDVQSNNTHVMDCKKPLGFRTIQVKQSAGVPGPDLIFEKQLKPTTLTMSANFPVPANNGNQQVWLRRVYVTGACGGTVTPSATLQLLGNSAPQKAAVKLAFGAASNNEIIVIVPPNQPTEAPLAVPSPLDCQAAGGIPSLDYALLSGIKASGKLEASEVMFEL